MSDAVIRTWSLDPWVVSPLLLAAVVYVRGWRWLRSRDARRWTFCRVVAFMSGLAALFLALASPIEAFSGLLLQVHMVQHLLLMMVAPPLIWLGAPFFPLLRGLPKGVRMYWIAPILRCQGFRRAFTTLTRPLIAWWLFAITTTVWHVPIVYETALRSDGWHYLQHASFLLAALIFWYPVVRPYPSCPAWSRWVLVPYLFLADVVNTILSAILTFAGEPLYPLYAELPRIGNISALDDQATAGVIMWVPGSVAYLLPLFVIGIRLLYGETKLEQRKKPARIVQGAVAPARFSLTLVHTPPIVRPTSRLDILSIPVIGAFLKWRHARLTLQTMFAVVAGVAIYDGLTGPQVSAMNVAGVVPWIHWRALLVFGLLAAGNVFCFGCPFLLPRTVARRWLPNGRPWPHWLRNKWPAILLLGLFFWAYEAFALWDSSWITAWIAIGYFAAPLVIDAVYRGAPFCKYICPIGQFNFVQSLISPLEVQTREHALCGSCRGKECIRGGDGVPGCELHLYQPRKSGNMDCTFCLDCVHACPHDNIAIIPTMSVQGLWQDRQGAGVGRLSRRPDVAVLVTLLVFAAFVNAAGMVTPVLQWQASMTMLLAPPRFFMTGLFFLIALIVAPTVLVSATAGLSALTSGGRVEFIGVYRNALRYCYSLIPLGFAMWLAHYSFHFFTSYETLIPVSERFLSDIGLGASSTPQWTAACCAPVASWLLRLEIAFLDVGLLLSLYTAYRIARSESFERPMRAAAPWAVLIILLFAAGIWILCQPMQMRGTLEG